MLVWDAGKASAALLLVSKKKLLIYPKGSNAGPLPLYVKKMEKNQWFVERDIENESTFHRSTRNIQTLQKDAKGQIDPNLWLCIIYISIYIYTLMQQMRRAKVLWKHGKQGKGTAAGKELDEIFCKKWCHNFFDAEAKPGWMCFCQVCHKRCVIMEIAYGQAKSPFRPKKAHLPE